MHSQIALPVAACAAWRAGEDEAAPPAVGFIEPQLRRRLSLLDRIALHVAHACVKDGEAVRVVFASRHGELARSAELLAQLAACEMPSPMAFSLSVLNAAPGLYGIARKDRSASTAVSAGVETFPMALVEAAAQAWAEPDLPVVVAFADEPPPAVYRSLVDTPRRAHALGLRLDARAAKHHVTMRWAPSDRDEEPEAAPVAFRACVENGVDTAWHGGGRAWHWTQHGRA
ncbi:MAG TPA: beta-ketoacyl synthase chain length factor [Burkholderiales bacterium]|nr:beta-ketoacyl synthase chain length factor [Burkholderiales bacterium]